MVPISPPPSQTEIRYAFRKCPDRIEVLKFFIENKTTYCGEICKHTGLPRRAITGILRGNSYYAERLSFVSMGLIEEFADDKNSRIKQYRILENEAKKYEDILRSEIK